MPRTRQDHSGAERKMWALRMTEDEKLAIRARANKVGMDMGRYMVLSALGEMIDPDSVRAELEEIRGRLDGEILDRLDALERLAGLGGLG
jgi:hypothetical protein